MFRYNPDNFIMVLLSKAGSIMLTELMWAVLCMPVITIGASTTAMCTIMWRIKRKEDVCIIREFWAVFRREWRDATRAWLIFLALGIVLLLDIFACFQMHGSAFIVTFMKWSTILFGLLYIMVFHWLFAGIAKYKATTKEAICNAFFWVAVNWKQTLLMTCLTISNVIAIALLEWIAVPLIGFNSYLQNSMIDKIYCVSKKEKVVEGI
ncbi:YesL family protein [uncultured Dysosmobacter sp.]|uniref:YesL family protein n=1 Tax=uncultured Dysosmobacter sp. TaxID=2591384 RepID=UPI00260E56DE|nr:YesL family protein [uncultured Dysosmobacter sp.]